MLEKKDKDLIMGVIWLSGLVYLVALFYIAVHCPVSALINLISGLIIVNFWSYL